MSGPDMVTVCMWTSFVTAFTSNVFPQPPGPNINTPLGTVKPRKQHKVIDFCMIRKCTVFTKHYND